MGATLGRPQLTTRDDAEAILSLMEGSATTDPLPLIRAAKALGMPYTTAYECLQRYPDLSERLDRAKEGLADFYADGALTTLDDGLTLILDEKVDAKRSNAIASATRNISDRRAWAARMLSPTRYGDKVQHSGAIEHRAVVLLPQLVAAPAVTAPTVRATLAAGDDGNAPARQDGRAAAELTALDNTGELSTS